MDSPGPDLVGVSFRGICLLQRFGFVEVAIGNAHEACRPFIFVGGVDALESLFYVGWVEADQRILPDLGATNGFGLDFVNGAFASLLSESYMHKNGYDSEKRNKSNLSSIFHVLVPLTL